jgi:UDP-GlcNAc:undecaprenyl-phosphate GlcNAc-1-phosphate transferase
MLIGHALFFALAPLIAIITFATITLLSPVARRLKLIDHPGGRKQHDGATPLIGGPSVFIVFAVASLILVGPTWLALCGLLLVALGILDDRYNIRASLKLLAQIGIATIAVVHGDIVMTKVGVLVQGFWQPSYLTYQLLSIFAIVGVINSFNMIDGIDGLCASLAGGTIISLNVTFIVMGALPPPDFGLISILFVSALVGFLFSNLQIAKGSKSFLGDSGSMLAGFMVGSLSIVAGEGNPNITGSWIPSTIPLWAAAIPIADTLSLMVRRIARGRSPFSPDLTHLHHIIQRIGFTARMTLLIIIAESFLLAIFGGYIALTIGNELSLALFVLYLGIYFSFAAKAAKWVRKGPRY